MSETTNNEQVKGKSTAKKVLGIVVNVLVGIILVLVLFISISVISSRGKGYTAIFGKAYIAVESFSMVGDGEDNFTRGDLVIMDELDDEEKNTLEVGEIVTFYDEINGERELNTHRVIEVIKSDGGSVIQVRTQGDANPDADPIHIISDVVGRYDGQVKGLGHFVLFFNTQWGFFTCIVLPSIIVVIVCALNLLKVILDNRKVKAQQDDVEKEERIKAELLAQLAAQGLLPKTDEAKPEATATAEPTATKDKD